MYKNILWCSILLSVFASCKQPNIASTQNTTPLQYAKLFKISGDTLFTLNTKNWLGTKLHHTNKPLRIIVLSTVFAGFIEALEQTNSIIGVDNINFYSDSIIWENYKNGKITEVGEEGLINIEKVLSLKPDYLIVSTFGSDKLNRYQQLEAKGIKIIYCNNFKENTPLARAEWIKAFGSIYGLYPKADSIFTQIANEYNFIKNKVKTNRPKVLTDAPFGDIWYIPGGNSYTAQLINDAGGKYIFDYKTKSYSFPLSLEEVLQEARNADYWINVNQFKNTEQIENFDKRLTIINAFINKKIYNHDKQDNSRGGNPFWESGAVYPNLILSDLYNIFYQDKTENKRMYYYRQLE